jgi:two-component system chemotaxis sensor kinase CheA
MDKKEVFRRKLLATFKVEAQEHLGAISDGLIKLEKNHPDDSQTGIIEKVFRAAHSLKGAARAVNLSDIEAACQVLESIFAAMKRREITALPDFFDTLHHALDRLTAFLSSSDFEEGEGKRLQTGDLAFILREALEGALLNKPAAPRGSCEDAPPSGGKPAESEPPHLEAMMRPSFDGEVHPIEETSPELPVPAGSAPDMSPGRSVGKMVETQSSVSDNREFSETVRIPTARLDTLLLQAEEMLLTKLAGSRRIAELREIHQALSTWRREWNRTYLDVRKLLNVSEKPAP